MVRINGFVELMDWTSAVYWYCEFTKPHGLSELNSIQKHICLLTCFHPHSYSLSSGWIDKYSLLDSGSVKAVQVLNEIKQKFGVV